MDAVNGWTDGRGGRENGILATGLAPTGLWISAEMEHAQSGLGAYVRATTTFHWTISSIVHRWSCPPLCAHSILERINESSHVRKR
jgi:hypothetical protein